MKEQLERLRRSAHSNSVDQLNEYSKKHMRALTVIKEHIRNEGRPPTRMHIATTLGFKSAQAVNSAISTLCDLNYLKVIRYKNASISLKGKVTVPVIDSKDVNDVSDNVTLDVNLFPKPPHYVIRLHEDKGMIGKKGSLLVVHKPLVAEAHSSVVVWPGGEAKFLKNVEDTKLKSVFDGIIVGMIRAFE